MGNYGELWAIIGNYRTILVQCAQSFCPPNYCATRWDGVYAWVKWMVNHWSIFKRYVKDVLAKSDAALAQDVVQDLTNYLILWLQLNFLKECAACVYAPIEHSQARTVGTLRDRRVHKPHIHRAWGLLSALRARLNSYTTDFGPATESLLKKESDGRRWYTAGDRESLKAVLNAAVQKSDKYLGLLVYAKSARVFDPRQREQLPKEIENYVTADKVQRVVPGNMAATLATEWELYWTLPAVPAQLDLMAWWRGMKSQLPQMATLAIRTLSIPHTATDVERCNSFYKLTRTDKQPIIPHNSPKFPHNSP